MIRSSGAYLGLLDDEVLRDVLRSLKHLVRHALGSGTTVRHVVLDTEVVVGASGVVAGGQEDTTVCLVLPDDVGGSGSGQDRVLSDDEPGDTIRRPNLEDDLHGLGGVVTAITTNDESLSFGVDRIEDGLDEVFGVVLRAIFSSEGLVERDAERQAYLLLENLHTRDTTSSAGLMEIFPMARTAPFSETRGSWLLVSEGFSGDFFDWVGHDGGG